MTNNSMTPRTDACHTHSMINHQKWCDKCGGFVEGIFAGNIMCCRCDPKADRIKELEAEVERLNKRMKEAEDLIKWLHDSWEKLRKAHLETCKNAQAEINKLHTETVCLQELIQEFYEWTRRDFPTEQEVREIMNRYHDLLNK